jgi:Protein of unknown function (DUF2946)
MARIFSRRATRALPTRPARTWRLGGWLGLAGIVLQALFPLLLATANLADAHAAAPLPGQSAIHPAHSGHGPAPHAPPAGHSHGPAAHCVLCLGLHAVGPMAVPDTLALPVPVEDSGTIRARIAARPQIDRPPAPYASRAPPGIA